MLVDYHMHTPLCKHAVGRPDAYAQQAVARGIPEIGFSDHNPMPPWYDWDFRMAHGQLGAYLAEIRRLQKEFAGRLTIRLGLEADYFPGTEEYVRETLASTPLDYVIGSVHYIGSWPMDNPNYAEEFQRRDLAQVWREYWDLVGRLGATRLYDILGHADVVKKFGHRPKKNCDGMVRAALRSIRRAGMTMEINTSGLRKPCREIYPSPRILELAFAEKVPLTLGSDSHDPKDVGADFDRAVELARSVGYRSIWRYEARRRFEEGL
jgi:histidinol-phosphatase (PHP family)